MQYLIKLLKSNQTKAEIRMEMEGLCTYLDQEQQIRRLGINK